ncbi:MAG: 4-hydroxythreonine-4-phosphate dehydrogenase PdxA [Candidatus Rokubacteria bacterium]|nr:4-hydroxythreonine-4-phosphate dehydrogenase PdxA [Candidatus Rokubacteria bacterium]
MSSGPILGITMGDPAGIGPEIAVKALADPVVRKAARLLVIGDARVMTEAARLARVDLAVRPVARVADATWATDRVEVLDLGNADPAAFAVGRVGALCGRAAYEYIERGVTLALAGEIDGIVTGPISKEALAAAGLRHSGHTEILAELTGTRAYAMLLMGRELRVIHVTTHVALRRVPELVTRERVHRTIRLGHEAMRRLGLAAPRLAVCGLNPHAGEAGLFGAEEQEAIAPAIADARAEGIDATGPYPADTLMSRARGGEFDCVVAMYHDQGHIPVKTLGFRYDDATRTWTGMSGVNVTVGLPILRVSVDHGTAFDRAGRGTANPESMVEAITVAAEMATRRASG